MSHTHITPLCHLSMRVREYVQAKLNHFQNTMISTLPSKLKTYYYQMEFSVSLQCKKF